MQITQYLELDAMEQLVTVDLLLDHYQVLNSWATLPKGIDVRNAIERAWFGCDFANRQIKIKPLESKLGWLGCITKEVTLARVDAWNIQSIKEPQNYINSLA